MKFTERQIRYLEDQIINKLAIINGTMDIKLEDGPAVQKIKEEIFAIVRIIRELDDVDETTLARFAIHGE